MVKTGLKTFTVLLLCDDKRLKCNLMPFDKLIQLIASAKHFYFMSRMNDDDGGSNDGGNDGQIGTYICGQGPRDHLSSSSEF